MATVTLNSAFNTDNFWAASTSFISNDGTTYKFQNAGGFVKVTGNSLVDNGSGVPLSGNYTAIDVYSDAGFTTLVAHYNSASNVGFATYFSSGGATALAGADTITGSSGNDTIRGYGGADTLDGGDGSDTYVFKSGEAPSGEVISDSGGSGTDTINAQDFVVDFTQASISGIERLSISASGQANFVASQLPANLIVSGNTGSGENILISGASTFSAAGWTFSNWGDPGDVIFIAGTGAVDTITGSSQTDKISLSAGADQLDGGDGSDTYYTNSSGPIDSGTVISDTGSLSDTDTIWVFSVGGADFTAATISGVEALLLYYEGTFTAAQMAELADVTFAVSGALTIVNASNFDVGDLTLHGWDTTHTITISGTAGADTLTGSGVNETFIGGQGADTIDGKNGSDTYVIDIFGVTAGEQITDTGTGVGDIDTIKITGFLTTANFLTSTVSGIEKVIFTDNQTAQFNQNQLPANLIVVGVNGSPQQINVTVTGASFSTASWTFTTWEATDKVVIIGAGAAENITGSEQNEFISGLGGADNMDGAGGSDTYQFFNASEINGDQITDTGLSGTDTLRLLADSIDFAAASSITGIEALSISAAATASFNASQFGATLIVDTLAVTGFDALQQDIVVNNAANFSAAGWTFGTWEATDTVTINGTASADTITGSSVAATINGLAGNDVLIGGAGDDELDGGADNDTVSYASATQAVAATLTGGGEGGATGADIGSDTLHGIENLTGGAGGDSLTGDENANILDGGAGDDTLLGNAGGDVFKVSTGNDTITDFGARYFTASMDEAHQVPPTGSPAAGSAKLVLSRAQVLTIDLSTSGLDFDGAQTGDPNDNVNGFHIHAGAAGVNGGIVWDIQADPDTVVNAPAGTVSSKWSGATLAAQLAALGSDGLYVNIHTTQFGGGAIRGQVEEVGAGPDKIDLTALNIGSFATWQAIAADVAGSAKMTTISDGVSSSLTTTGVTEAMFTAADFIFAGNVVQTLDGGENADDLFGAGGNDTLNGAGGSDRLFGEADNDILNGDDGDDTLSGGLGKDTMTGGLGADTFDFNLKTETAKGANRDVITDFLHGTDHIDLHDIDAKSKKAGDQDFKFIGTKHFHHKAGELHFVKMNKPGTAHDKTIVEGDINGDGKADFQIELSHLIKLNGGDFYL